MIAISLGWGVQSFAMAAMAALGELPPVDVAIHADTTHEREGTYRFAEKWTPWLEARGVKVVTVKPKSAVLVDKYGGVMIPAYTDTEEGGQIKRQCTGDWKIDPIRKWLREHRDGRLVVLWQGITTNEYQRAKESGVKWLIHQWPLLFDKPMSRIQCANWLLKNGLRIPPRSACTFCPFQSSKEWRTLSVKDREQAIAADEFIRDRRPPESLYVHRSMTPLQTIDLRTEQEIGQMELWANECTGHCGT